MKSLADKLRQEPGIDVKRLKVGMRLMVETESAVYEMRGATPGLEPGGNLVQRSRPAAAYRRAVHRQPASACVRDPEGWIGKGLLMYLRFRNGYYFSAPVLSAEVKGDTWHYTVF